MSTTKKQPTTKRKATPTVPIEYEIKVRIFRADEGFVAEIDDGIRGGERQTIGPYTTSAICRTAATRVLVTNLRNATSTGLFEGEK